MKTIRLLLVSLVSTLTTLGADVETLRLNQALTALGANNVEIVRLSPPPNLPLGKILTLNLNLAPPVGYKITGITVLIETEPVRLQGPLFRAQPSTNLFEKIPLLPPEKPKDSELKPLLRNLTLGEPKRYLFPDEKPMLVRLGFRY